MTLYSLGRYAIDRLEDTEGEFGEMLPLAKEVLRALL
jgi:hypothetical protein